MIAGESVASVQGLRKKFGRVVALDGVDFTLGRGEIVGIVGNDGAGKSTLLASLAGLVRPDVGRVTVLGTDPAKHRSAKIGYMSEGFTLYPTLSVEENLDFAAGLRGVPHDRRERRKAELFAFSRLDAARSRPARDLSGGMQKKLALACALIHDPEVLLLDEPTTGVDPISRRDFWELLLRSAGEGRAIAVATPYLDEAERFHRVIFLHAGRVVAQGTPAELRAGLAGNVDSSSTPPTLEDVFIAMLAGETKQSVRHASPTRPPPPSADIAIAVQDVHVRFGSHVALAGISLNVGAGEIFGLLGPNGSGKSTLIRVLTGVLRPTSGTARVSGADATRRPRALRSAIGYMSQRFTLYGDLTVRENLDLAAGMYNVAPEALRVRERDLLFGLDDRVLRTRTDAVPGGFRQRLALACATVHQPRVVFLDEPTAGVDPLARRDFWDRIREIASEGAAVLVTTHFLDEAEYCDRIGLLLDGRLIALGTPQALKQQAIPGSIVVLPVNDGRRAVDLLAHLPAASHVTVFGASVHVTLAPGGDPKPLGKALRDAGIATGEPVVSAPSLEDAFIALVERQPAA